jgi:hypothetical protein
MSAASVLLRSVSLPESPSPLMSHDLVRRCGRGSRLPSPVARASPEPRWQSGRQQTTWPIRIGDLVWKGLREPTGGRGRRSASALLSDGGVWEACNPDDLRLCFGERVRPRRALLSVDEINPGKGPDGGPEVLRLTYLQTVPVEGAGKPGMVAETLTRSYV